MDDQDLLGSLDGLPPAELGALLHRRPHPRLVAAALLDLAQRGHLRVECTSRTRWEDGPTWRLVTAPRAAWSAADGLRPHEVRLLDVVAGLDDPDLGALRASRGAAEVQRTLRADVAARGWRRSTRPRWTTAQGRALLPRVRAAREVLAHGSSSDLVAHLPLATALGALGASDDERAPGAGDGVGGPVGGPAWFAPGWREEDRGWRGALALARAAGHREPASLDWGELGSLGGVSW